VSTQRTSCLNLTFVIRHIASKSEPSFLDTLPFLCLMYSKNPSLRSRFFKLLIGLCLTTPYLQLCHSLQYLSGIREHLPIITQVNLHDTNQSHNVLWIDNARANIWAIWGVKSLDPRLKIIIRKVQHSLSRLLKLLPVLFSIVTATFRLPIEI
jgi:hypothetical protein